MADKLRLDPYTPVTGTDDEISELLRQGGYGSEDVPNWVDEEQAETERRLR